MAEVVNKPQADDPAIEPEVPESSIATPLLILAAVVLAAVVLGYSGSFVFLSDRWNEPENSHGYLVLPIAAVIAWLRRDRIPRGPIRPRFWLGLAVMIATLAARHLLYEKNDQLVEAATLPLVLAAMILALGGFRLLLWALPPLALTIFLIPMPYRINMLVTDPLQRVATLGSCWLLTVVQIPAISEGNVILVGDHRLEVEQACSGLAMLQTFAFLISAVVITIPMPWFKRGLLLLSIVPIALASNILRIAVTAWCYQNGELESLNWFIGLFNYDSIFEFTHDAAGYFMMPVAGILVYLELAVLSLVVVPEDRMVIDPIRIG